MLSYLYKKDDSVLKSSNLVWCPKDIRCQNSSEGQVVIESNNENSFKSIKDDFVTLLSFDGL